jgi:hypothetical protein
MSELDDLVQKRFIPSAFPNSYAEGMSLRDYFAAAALTGLLNDIHIKHKTAITYSYMLADQMLDERKKRDDIFSRS